jgi:hypothetical protein
MSPRLVIPVLVALGFSAGFGTRFITERDVSLPLPPAVGQEFAQSGTTTNGDTKPVTPPKSSGVNSNSRATLIADIEANLAQIHTYQERMRAIETDFDRELVAMLDPQQLQHKEELKKTRAAGFNKGKGQGPDDRATRLMSDAEIDSIQQIYLLRALDTVAIKPRFNYLNREYKLTPAQQVEALRILEIRREKFLRLIDEIPPPSIRLVGLASRVKQLAEPETPPPAK